MTLRETPAHVIPDDIEQRCLAVAYVTAFKRHGNIQNLLSGHLKYLAVGYCEQ